MDYGFFYDNVKGDLIEIVLSRCNEVDVIQLELRGDMVESDASVIAPISVGMNLTQFQDLFERTIQSSFSVLTDSNL